MSPDALADGTPQKNLEFKARLGDLATARRHALALGATEGAVLAQVDTYFRAVSGRLKLREINGTVAELIAYDRPEGDAHRWSRYRRVAVGDPAGMKAALSDAMGLRGIVAKTRHLYLWNDCRIHLDEVEQLGTFLEFEVISQGDEAFDRDRMASLMSAFELGEADGILASYSDLRGL